MTRAPGRPRPVLTAAVAILTLGAATAGVAATASATTSASPTATPSASPTPDPTPSASPTPDPTPSPSPAPKDTVEIPISFEVKNENLTPIPCEGVNGETYTLEGVLSAPASALQGGDDDTATLVLHGLGYGSFFSNFELLPGYDFLEKQAEAGNVTVAVNRLGYDDSAMPDGSEICIGSHATMAHQMVVALRNGDYTLEGHKSEAFENVVLAGHSVGGLIAEAEAYSLGDIDGLVVLSYSDVVQSDLAVRYAMNAVEDCTENGGQPSERGAPHYVPYGDDPGEFIVGHFATGNADPEVIFTTADLRNIDPCGDLLSFTPAVMTNLDHLNEIDVPVLVLAGSDDNFFPPPAVDKQTDLFTGSEDVTGKVIADTGHALTLHFTADEFSNELDRWLDERFPSGSHG